MIVVNETEFKDYTERVSRNEVDLVNYKVVLRIELKKQVKISYLKSLIRGIFFDANIPIRLRVDVGEDYWIGKESLMGETLVVVRVKDNHKNILDDLNESIKNLNLENLVSIKNLETFNVDEFTDITDKFNRALYGLKLDIKEEVTHTYSESNGGWFQKVRLWDDSIEEKRVDGVVRVKLKRMESKSPVYKILIDVPYGLDVYRILEQEFNFKKNSLIEYPVQGVRFYEGIDSKKSYINRKKCPVFGDPIEMTVGGLVGEKSISALMGLEAVK